MLNRRRFLQTALTVGALPAALSLSGCESLIDVLGDACPEDAAESGGIDWTPDVLHPVSWASRELTTADGAPQKMRIYYPSYAFNDSGRILKLCLDRWPLVLFLHGLPPSPPCPPSNPANYLRWRSIPILLARSGYVVAVPDYSATVPAADSALIDRMLSVIDWLRTDWQDARWVDKRAASVAVAGHSFGALLAARLAQRRPGLGAYIAVVFHVVQQQRFSAIRRSRPRRVLERCPRNQIRRRPLRRPFRLRPERIQLQRPARPMSIPRTGRRRTHRLVPRAIHVAGPLDHADAHRPRPAGCPAHSETAVLRRRAFSWIGCDEVGPPVQRRHLALGVVRF